MILVVGGAASGKLEYVRSLGYDAESIADGVMDSRPALVNLQKIVAADPEMAPGLLDDLIEKEVVACDEVGSGVIPVTRDLREAREATGRLCNQLATHAERVIRLVSGIPVVIK